jgi:hypothetical protein
MGYRSDWQIVFNTYGHAQKVRDTLDQYVTAHTTDAAKLMGEMLQTAVTQFDTNVLVLGDSSWKLGAWDDLTHIIHALFADDPEIDIGWIRLGEDETDNESRSGDFTRMYVTRYIEADWDLVLPAKAPSGPTMQAVCQCDINQIFRGEGHDVGCPDRS